MLNQQASIYLDPITGEQILLWEIELELTKIQKQINATNEPSVVAVFAELKQHRQELLAHLHDDTLPRI